MTKTCKDADKNPDCPYLEQIRQQGEDIKTIKRAIIGDDMQGGIVAEIQKFKILWKITIFLAATSTTGLIALVLKAAFHL